MKPTRVENAVMFEHVEYILHVVWISVCFSLHLDHEPEHFIFRHPAVFGVIVEKCFDFLRWLTWFNFEASCTTETHFECHLHFCVSCESYNWIEKKQKMLSQEGKKVNKEILCACVTHVLLKTVRFRSHVLTRNLFYTIRRTIHSKNNLLNYIKIWTRERGVLWAVWIEVSI